MATVFGREHELREIARVLDGALKGNAAVSMRVSGGSGIGKTALLEAAGAAASEAGWLTVQAACHRIQAQVPGSANALVIRSLVETMGNDASRYTTGLSQAVDDALSGKIGGPQLHQTLLRLLEGVLLDHAVFIAIDDAQWVDAQSGESIEEILAAFSARPLALLRLERSREARAYEFTEPDESMALQPLPTEVAGSVARAHYPQAPPDVIASIVAHAGGHPVDIVALAESARENVVRVPGEIDGSLRAAVARQVNRLDPKVREFLQTCALMAEPVDYSLLATLWPDEAALSALIDSVSGRFLIQTNEGMRFAHHAIAESVRHTLAVEIPFRRRILNGLIATGGRTLEDFERIVEQAAACGDRQLERTYLLKLAGEATKRSALSAAAAAYRRALTIARPGREEFIPFFLQYAGVLMVQNHMLEAKDVLLDALRSATDAGVTEGLGALANTLIIATSRTGGRAPALEIAGYYLKRYQAPGDRVFLLSGAAWLQSCRLDLPAFEAHQAEMRALGLPIPEVIEMRMCIAEAFLQTRLGNYTAAAPLIDRAAAHMTSVPSALRAMVDMGRLSIELLQFGGRQFEERIEPIARQYADDNLQISFIEYLKSLVALGRGDLPGARELAAEMLAQRVAQPDRQRLLSVVAAVAAWQNDEGTHAALIEEELNAFFLDDRSEMLVPLAAWWSAAIAGRRPSEARDLLERVIPRLSEPFDMDTLLFPVAATMAAVRLGDRALIKRVLENADAAADRSPWQLAQQALATGYAREMLTPGSATAALAELARRFDGLALPFFGALSRTIADPSNEIAAAFLRQSGVRSFKPLRDAVLAGTGKKGSAPATQARPSKRELEIIGLVADGKTNRQMAEMLFLSERTIEGHLSNIFNKLNVSSRTQVAAWYFSSTAAG